MQLGFSHRPVLTKTGVMVARMQTEFDPDKKASTDFCRKNGETGRTLANIGETWRIVSHSPASHHKTPGRIGAVKKKDHMTKEKVVNKICRRISSATFAKAVPVFAALRAVFCSLNFPPKPVLRSPP